MKTLRESILGSQDKIMGDATSRAKDILDWYRAWEKFDKEFWEKFPRLASKASHIDDIDEFMSNFEVTVSRGGSSTPQYERKQLMLSCDKKYFDAVRKVFRNIVRELSKKYFSDDTTFMDDRAGLIMWNVKNQGYSTRRYLLGGYIEETMSEAGIMTVVTRKYMM